MKYCLDASVAMKWVLPEPDTPKAVMIRNEFRVGLPELIAPDVFVPEVSHGLTKAERRGVIAAARECNATMAEAFQTAKVPRELPEAPGDAPSP